jgi:Ni/Co efflux regulator RcnB
MKFTNKIFTSTVACFALTATLALADGHGQGNGKAKGHEKHEDENDGENRGHEDRGRDKHYSKDHDRLVARGWYDEHQGHLPPGLAKRDQLPPGLQRQLVVRGTLPPGLQKRLQPVPQDLEVRLAPPPPECAHVLIGGNIVLLNRRTNLVVDIVAF